MTLPTDQRSVRIASTLWLFLDARPIPLPTLADHCIDDLNATTAVEITAVRAEVAERLLSWLRLGTVAEHEEGWVKA